MMRSQRLWSVGLLLASLAVLPAWAGNGGEAPAGDAAMGVAEDTPQDASPGESTAGTDSRYRVRVEVNEAENRVVEGRVRSHTIRIDQPKEFGGDDTAPTPPETMAFAVGSCVVSTGRLLAMLTNVDVRSISAVVDGELDFARALGKSQETRAGYQGLKVTVRLDTDMTDRQKADFVREIAARCPMCDNVLSPTPVSIELDEPAVR